MTPTRTRTVIEGRVDASRAHITTAGSEYRQRKSRVAHDCGMARSQHRGCHRRIAPGDVHVQLPGDPRNARYCVSCASLRLGLTVRFLPGAWVRVSEHSVAVTPRRRISGGVAAAWAAVTVIVGLLLLAACWAATLAPTVTASWH